METLKYIDLFAGIGGFHQALNKIGNSECVFASEIDKSAIKSYKENYNIDSNNDITQVNPLNLPEYDLLCAGFPCQAFSKAGNQEGFNDETKGTLFFEIERLLQSRIEQENPVKYIMLENVANLVTHDQGRTWKVIKKHLKVLGYIISETPIVLSPHQLNENAVPQLRKRVFIMGIHKNYSDKKELTFVLPKNNRHNNLVKLSDLPLEEKVDKKYYLSEFEINVLNFWDEFKREVQSNTWGFPIWLEEMKEEYSLLELPKWKANILEKNRTMYKNNKTVINKLIKNNKKILSKMTDTQKKFEWQAGEDIKTLYEGIIQIRPSGIRVKRPTEVPALVAIVHVPIIGWKKRRLTVREAARLQSFPENFIPNEEDFQAYKQFGNSVNVNVVYYLLKQLLEQ